MLPLAKNLCDMEQNSFFSPEEKVRLTQLYRELLKLSGSILYPDDCKKIKRYLIEAVRRDLIRRNVFGMNLIISDMETALIVASEIGLTRGAIVGIMVHTCVRCGYCSPEDVEKEFGEDVAGIIRGLNRIQELYEKTPTVESENFRSLLLSFAEDMRVILIMIANRVNVMRQIKDTENKEAQHRVSEEAAYLYAPLAHKLGLYRLKSELEEIDGIGARTIETLLSHFRTVARIREASDEELARLIGAAKTRRLREHFAQM